jgi:hypothetical protein
VALLLIHEILQEAKFQIRNLNLWLQWNEEPLSNGLERFCHKETWRPLSFEALYS